MTRRIVMTTCKAALGLGLVLTLAGPAAAQAPKPARGVAQADVEVGVSAVDRVTNKGVTNVYKGGFYAGTSWRVRPLISVFGLITADFDKRDDYTANLYAYTGGARFRFVASGGKVTPFAQVVLGLGQDNGIDNETPNKTNYYPYLAPGVGADLAVSARVAIRVRLDFPIMMRYSDSYTGTRLSIGLSVPLGGR